MLSTKELNKLLGTRELSEAYNDVIISVLESGGENAVNLLKQIKGNNVSSDELVAVYNAAMDPLRTATEDLTKGVGETVSGISIGIME